MNITNTNETSHDKHYNVADKRFGTDPIRVMEGIVCLGIPEEYWDICKRNLNLALDFKYVSRLGDKDDPIKELDKSGNYRYRARNKCWPWFNVNKTPKMDHQDIASIDPGFAKPPFEMIRDLEPQSECLKLL